jgi:hypothetical protein
MSTTLPAVVDNKNAVVEEKKVGIAKLKSNKELLKNTFTLDDATSVVTEGKITGDELDNVVRARDKAEKSKNRWNKVAFCSGVVAGACAFATEKAPTPQIATKFFCGAAIGVAVTTTALGFATRAGNKLDALNDRLLTLAGKKKQNG